MLNGVSPTLFRVSRQSDGGDVNELLRDPRRIAGIAAKVDQQKTPEPATAGRAGRAPLPAA
jgi:hypothetical protein